VRSADRIFVLERGHLVEGGSHDQLLTQSGRCAELFSLQASAYSSSVSTSFPAPG
jgi:ABC-type multidrug transport system fused ATPase/permease subunit